MRLLIIIAFAFVLASVFMMFDGSILSSSAEEVHYEAWNSTYGGSGEEEGDHILITDDGDYLISGITESYGSGEMDLWLILLEPDGTEKMTRTIGDSQDDVIVKTISTSDSGYLVLAIKRPSFLDLDIWVIKYDSDLIEEWNRTYDLSGSLEVGFDVIQIADGGYIITGSTYTYPGSDHLIMKIDGDGDIEWWRDIETDEDDSGTMVIPAGDGGYYIAGETESFGQGGEDVWLIKVDSNGYHLWNRTYGGPTDDSAVGIIQTPQGLTIVGITTSFGGGHIDGWLIRTNTQGIEQWNKTYGQDDLDQFTDMTFDGTNILVSGAISSYEQYSSDYQGWAMELDLNGDMLWNWTCGGPDEDVIFHINRDDDGKVVLTGSTDSYGSGASDLWVIGLDTTERPLSPVLSDGQTQIEASKRTEFTLSSVDPDGDDLCIKIDWGDGIMFITGENSSGASMYMSHAWLSPGTYHVRARSIDTHQVRSDWVEIATINVGEPPKDDGSSSDDGVMGMPVSMIGGLLAVLVIIILVVLIRRRKGPDKEPAYRPSQAPPPDQWAPPPTQQYPGYGIPPPPPPRAPPPPPPPQQMGYQEQPYGQQTGYQPMPAQPPPPHQTATCPGCGSAIVIATNERPTIVQCQGCFAKYTIR